MKVFCSMNSCLPLIKSPPQLSSCWHGRIFLSILINLIFQAKPRLRTKRTAGQPYPLIPRGGFQAKTWANCPRREAWGFSAFLCGLGHSVVGFKRPFKFCQGTGSARGEQWAANSPVERLVAEAESWRQLPEATRE